MRPGMYTFASSRGPMIMSLYVCCYLSACHVAMELADQASLVFCLVACIPRSFTLSTVRILALHT